MHSVCPQISEDFAFTLWLFDLFLHQHDSPCPNTHFPLCQVVHGAKVVSAGEMFVLTLSFTPGVSQVLTQLSVSRWISHLTPKSICQYANSLLPQHATSFWVLRRKPSGWALIQDGCCPHKNGKLSHRFKHIERTPLEHEDSYLQAQRVAWDRIFSTDLKRNPADT